LFTNNITTLPVAVKVVLDGPHHGDRQHQRS